jgi:ribonuclease VapC
MIVETSAFVALVFYEPERIELLERIAGSDDEIGMSAANVVEASIVINARGTASQRRLSTTLRSELGIHVEPVTAAQAELASSAYSEFGRGSGHAAQLNFGDCFAYALAIDKDEPLLFVGDGFAHTDVRPARLP